MTVTKGTKQVDVFYGPERNRFKRIDTDATSTATTHTIGGKLSPLCPGRAWRRSSPLVCFPVAPDGAPRLLEAIDRGTVAERKHTIGGFAVITEYVSTGVFEHAYFLSDYLGSIDTITDQSCFPPRPRLALELGFVIRHLPTLPASLSRCPPKPGKTRLCLTARVSCRAAVAVIFCHVGSARH